MKSVLISIKPKWCELIASGKKTVEVRKTKPKLETPFKVYIYATEPRYKKDLGLCLDDGKVGLIYKWNYEYARIHKIPILSGKVIGEFVCDRIDGFNVPYPAYFHECDSRTRKILQSACLTPMDIHRYNGVHATYGWHISDLIIYDQPRGVTGFYHYCGDDPKCDGCELLYYSNTECGKEEFCCSNMYGCKHLERPPQSWCYVEQLKGE
jgi:hypothetical protein